MIIGLALGMVVVAVVLLSIERIPIEVSSLAIVVLLVFSGLVTPSEALAGFSSETAIFIFALLALTQGLGATGVMQLIGRRMVVFARMGSTAFTVALLSVVGAFSAVASNTAVTAAFLPVATGSAVQAKIPSSRLLMPMAFASMLGGTVTLFGTSTNLVVSASMESLGLGRLGFLELAPLGLPLAVFGIAVTLVLTRWLLRARPEAESEAALAPREYVTEATLPEGSRLIGKPLEYLIDGLGVPVTAVVRSGRLLPAAPAEILANGDHLIVSGSLEDILRVKDLRSVGLRADLRYAAKEEQTLTLVEVSIPPTSSWVDKTVRQLRVADRYGVLVLAIHRHPSLRAEGVELLHLPGSGQDPRAVGDATLSTGDVLLVSGPAARVRRLSQDEDVSVLGTVEYERPRYRRALLALVIFAVTVLLAGTRVSSPAIIGLAGMLLMIATGCVPARTAFRVDWRVVILIGALLTLGTAMEKSGAGEFLAKGVLPVAELGGPRAVLVALMLGTILLSIPMSNQAAALVMIPVGVHAGQLLGFDARTFAIGICLAASCCFLTPLEPSAALVYGPGRYRFSDFLRVGAPLTTLMLVILSVGVPLFWPFRAA